MAGFGVTTEGRIAQPMEFAYDGAQMRCLIVDDSPTIQILLEHVLGAHGECDVAQNGQVALYAYHRALEEGAPYDLICLDLGLPYIKGSEVLAKIRESEALRQSSARTRIIVITGSRDADELRRVYEQGADCCLPKPIDPSKLLEQLKTFH